MQQGLKSWRERLLAHARRWGHAGGGGLPELAGWWLTHRDRCVWEPGWRRSEMGNRGEARWAGLWLRGRGFGTRIPLYGHERLWRGLSRERSCG